MFSYEEDKNANPTLFWVNPWNGQKESLAHFYWPTHDVKKPRLVEEFFDLMGQKCAEAAYAAWNAINNMEEASHAIAAHCGCPKHAPTDPKLAELLEATKDHVITPEEKEAQRQSWVRGEMGIGDDRAEAEDRKRMDAPAEAGKEGAIEQATLEH